MKIVSYESRDRTKQNKEHISKDRMSKPNISVQKGPSVFAFPDEAVQYMMYFLLCNFNSLNCQNAPPSTA